MPLPALASLEDYEAFTGRTLDEGKTAGVARLIELASATVRRGTRQTITAVEGDEITVWPVDEELVLPQRPVTAIGSIAINAVEVAAAGYRWNAQGRVDRISGLWTYDDPPVHLQNRWGWGRWPVTVVYDHGYTEVPDDLVAVTLSIACRLSNNPTGYQQESIDGYSYIVGAATLPEQQIIAAYRQQSGTTRVRS